MVAKDQKNRILLVGCIISTEEALPPEVRGTTVAAVVGDIQGDERDGGHGGQRRRIIRDVWEGVQGGATGN